MNQLKINEKIAFRAVDQFGEDFNLENIDKITIISIFPKINTSVCDEQTLKIHQLSNKYPNFNFIVLSIDKPEVLKQWCLSNGVANNNLVVLSDNKYKDFATKYNFLVKYKDYDPFLDRAILVLDKNAKLIYLERKNGNIGEQIKFDLLINHLNKLEE